MEIIRLPIGQLAPPEADCISIQTLPGGRFRLNASALLQCADEEEAESQTLFGGEAYDSYDEAEAAGLAWARDRCVTCVHVTCDAPLPE